MAERWTSRFADSAARELARLPAHYRLEALDLVASLLDTQTPPDSKPMRGVPYHRIAFGEGGYRLVYRLLKNRREVRVLRIRLRERAYEGLPSGSPRGSAS